MRLFMLGFNVFPVPYGRKGGYPWVMMQYTRINAQDIYPPFRDNCNIGVVTGRTSGNLFVIDCETKIVFEHHKELLKAANAQRYGTSEVNVSRRMKKHGLKKKG